MSDKKKETEKNLNLGLMGFSPDQWVTQAELRALSGHGQCAFITTHPVKPATKDDPDETVDDETQSDSSDDA